MASYYIGVDMGTSSCRAGLVSSEGSVVAQVVIVVILMVGGGAHGDGAFSGDCCGGGAHGCDPAGSITTSKALCANCDGSCRW